MQGSRYGSKILQDLKSGYILSSGSVCLDACIIGFLLPSLQQCRVVLTIVPQIWQIGLMVVLPTSSVDFDPTLLALKLPLLLYWPQLRPREFVSEPCPLDDQPWPL